MKLSATERTTQLRLALESDESGIWETIEAIRQRQLSEYLVRLWMQDVIARQRPMSPNAATSESSSRQS